MLALSNEPQQLVEMVLDKLLHLLKVDYGWVQLIGAEDRNLQLVASRGNLPETTGGVGLTDSQRILGERVIAGLKVVISDLSRDGQYGLSSFGLAGLRSLAAVPIRTYHTQGVIGVASRTRKRFDNETAELLMTIAGLVGATLNVADLGRIAMKRERQRVAEEMSRDKPSAVENAPESASTATPELPVAEENVPPDPPGTGIQEEEPTEDDSDDGGAFGDHVRKMTTFRRAHQEG